MTDPHRIFPPVPDRSLPMEARRMRRTTRSSPSGGLLAALVVALAAAAPPPARAASPDGARVKVTKLEVHATAQAGLVRLDADREPTFTVYKLDEPTRVVIDLTDADVTALARRGRIAGEGLVSAVEATQFDDARVRVGRVVITVADGTLFDVQTSATGLVVSLKRAAAAEKPVAVAPPPASRPKLDDKVVRVEVDRLPEGVTGGSRLLSARLSSDHGHARLTLACDGPIARYQLMELKEPGRVALDLAGFTSAARLRSRSAGEVTQLRIARHEGALRVVLQARGDRFPPFRIARTPRGLVVEVDPAAAPRVAARQAAHRLPDPRSTPVMTASAGEQPLAALPAPPAPASSAALIHSIDVSGKGRSTRIVVVLDRQVRVAESRAPDGSRLLLVHDALLPRRLARTLDASALEGPVATVASLGVPQGVQLVVGLRRGEGEAVSHLSTMRVGPSVGLVWTFTGTAPRELKLAQVEVNPEAHGPGGFYGEAPAYAMAAAPRAARQYTGKRVDFTAKDLDVIQFLQAIGEISKRNIVASDDVGGKVSIRLRNVPWDEALDIVLKTKGLGREEIGNIIRVAPLAKLQAEKKQAAEASQEELETEPLKVRLIPVSYAQASDLAARVKDVLTTRGTVSVDTRTNVLVVKDVVDSLAKAEQLVHILDTQTPQVLIEARIVEAQTTFTHSVGIQWGGNVQASPATANPTGLVFPNLVSIAGAATDSLTPTTATSAAPNFAVNMPTAIGTNTGGGVGFIFGSAGGAATLNLRLSAAEVNGTIKTVSAPRVATLDNQPASISQGVSVPFSQVSAAGVNTTFIEARLQLDVTPHVTADGSILLSIKATNNQPNPQLTGANGQPSISKREASTKVIVKDGDTTVIGGIYTRRHSLNDIGVPFFSKLPIIGALFQKKDVSDDRTEMLIFITPRIVNRQQSVVAGGDAP